MEFRKLRFLVTLAEELRSGRERNLRYWDPTRALGVRSQSLAGDLA